MRTVHCPLCGLRFLHGSELDQHARDEHAPPVVEGREVLRVTTPHHVDRPIDQVLQARRRRAADEAAS